LHGISYRLQSNPPLSRPSINRRRFIIRIRKSPSPPAVVRSPVTSPPSPSPPTTIPSSPAVSTTSILTSSSTGSAWGRRTEGWGIRRTACAANTTLGGWRKTLGRNFSQGSSATHRRGGGIRQGGGREVGMWIRFERKTTVNEMKKHTRSY